MLYGHYYAWCKRKGRLAQWCILELCLIRVQGGSTSHKSDSNPGNFQLKYFCVTCQVPNFQTCPNELLVMNHANSQPSGLREYIARFAKAADFPKAVEGIIENYEKWSNFKHLFFKLGCWKSTYNSFKNVWSLKLKSISNRRQHLLWSKLAPIRRPLQPSLGTNRRQFIFHTQFRSDNPWPKINCFVCAFFGWIWKKTGRLDEFG